MERNSGQWKLPRLAPAIAVGLAVMTVGSLVLVRGVLLGSGWGRPSSPPIVSASPSPTPVPSTAPSPTPVPSPSPVATIDRCHTSQLGLTFSVPPGSAGAGQRYSELIFKNTSGMSCTMEGYVGVQNLDSQSQPLPTNVVRNGNFFNSLGKTRVTLAPGAQAPMWFHYTVVPSGSETTCEQVAALKVIPPDETDSIQVAASLGSVCSHGELDVSPVMPPGTTFP